MYLSPVYVNVFNGLICLFNNHYRRMMVNRITCVSSCLPEDLSSRQTFLMLRFIDSRIG